MIRRLRRTAPFLILLTISFLQASVSATPEVLDGVIRVGLESASGKRSVTVLFTGPVKIGNEDEAINSTDVNVPSLNFILSGGSVECPALKLRSADGFRITPQMAGTFGIGKRRYRGKLEIVKDESGLRVINETDLEDYVYGALLIEGSPDMRPESLKALAVAIRTYGVRSRGKHGKGLYDVCDTTHCQGYLGAPTATGAWAKLAQSSTSGLILMWRDAPIWAAYSTDCGGATANNEDGGFGEMPWPYLRATADTDNVHHEYCALSSSHHWVKEIPVRQLEAVLNGKKATKIGKLADIAVDRADSYGRALTLKLESAPPPPLVTPDNPIKRASAATGESVFQTAATSPPSAPTALPLPTKTLRATNLRSLLGANVLKSTFFSVKKQGDVIRFEGRGYGHGVGMCMAGANGMAKDGIGYRDILGHYYTGTSIVQLYETLPRNLISGEGN